MSPIAKAKAVWRLPWPWLWCEISIGTADLMTVCCPCTLPPPLSLPPLPPLSPRITLPIRNLKDVCLENKTAADYNTFTPVSLALYPSFSWSMPPGCVWNPGDSWFNILVSVWRIRVNVTALLRLRSFEVPFFNFFWSRSIHRWLLGCIFFFPPRRCCSSCCLDWS